LTPNWQDTSLYEELEHRRLVHREARLQRAIRALEERVEEKRRHGRLIPLALRSSLEDFKRELRRTEAILGRPVDERRPAAGPV
jgi:hypothetical protein